MESDTGHELEWGRRDRILAAVDRMVQTGRLTEGEAEALRTAADASEFNHAVREIRVRHAGVKLDAAVADGSMTRTEADNLLERLRQGEHGGGLRSRLRSLGAHGRRDHG
jgi:Arc/MetJ-type ribon-helix-helix transcriptional regulator